MKSLDELDHYEVLELRPGARNEEIERAYQLIRAAYVEGSMALYSLFSSADAQVIRSRIDEAYRILANPDDRRSYDASVGINSELDDSPAGGGPGPGVGASSQSSDGRGPLGSAPSTGSVPTVIDVFEELDAGIDEEEQDFGGPALRRARLRRGVELSQISDVTKVSVSYLQRIEGEEFEELPAAVYVRGFVIAYARAIGLDPDRVSASYMERVNEAKGQTKRSGVTGRRQP